MPQKAVLITGLAGLLAGAGSMALGEWLSVQSSRELYTRQLDMEREELDTMPEEEEEELALIYQARGLDEPEARKFASSVMSNRDTALDAMAREELGIDPAELSGSAWQAAITSFFLFAFGAIVPVTPFFFADLQTGVMLSVVFSTAALFLVGAAVTLFTGRSVVFSGVRQVIFGLVAAGLVYMIGKAVGVTVSG
jgi:VIT1/CCC1 family predicted Fe2+/Mn2+ transporter